MSATPEDDQRVRAVAILGSIEGLSDRLRLLDPNAKTTDWTTIDRGIEDRFGAHVYEIVSGRVSVDFRVLGDRDYLNWYSDKPGFLTIGESMDSYLEFLEFTLGVLPDMLFGEEGDYFGASTASLKHRSIVKKDIKYSLGSDRDRIRLITELITRPRLHESLAIAGSRSDGSNPFTFITTFGQKAPAGYLSVGVNSSDSNASTWNPGVCGWALGTHLDRDKLGNIALASLNLSAQIAQIKSPAIGS